MAALQRGSIFLRKLIVSVCFLGVFSGGDSQSSEAYKIYYSLIEL